MKQSSGIGSISRAIKSRLEKSLARATLVNES